MAWFLWGKTCGHFQVLFTSAPVERETCSSGGQQAPDILQSPDPQATATVVTGVSVGSTGFLCGCWDLNSGSHSCRTKTLKAKSVIAGGRYTDSVLRTYICTCLCPIRLSVRKWFSEAPPLFFGVFALFLFFFFFKWAIAKFPSVYCALWQHPWAVPAEVLVVGVGYLRNRNALDCTDLIYSLLHFIETLRISILPE